MKRTHNTWRTTLHIKKNTKTCITRHQLWITTCNIEDIEATVSHDRCLDYKTVVTSLQLGKGQHLPKVQYAVSESVRMHVYAVENVAMLLLFSLSEREQRVVVEAEVSCSEIYLTTRG